MINRIRHAFERMRPQPEPTVVKVLHLDTINGPTTLIVRGWEPGASADCRFCPRSLCDCVGDVCAIEVPGHIHESLCATARLIDEEGGEN